MTLDEIKQQDFSPFDWVVAWRGRACKTPHMEDMYVNWMMHDPVTGQGTAGMTSRSTLMVLNADDYAADCFIGLADVGVNTGGNWLHVEDDWHCGSSYEFARWLCNLLCVPYCRRIYDS